MKFLIDMNLSPVWVDFLIGKGFEAVHWSAVGKAGAPDEEVMRWAAERDHVVVTADLDFPAVLAATRRRSPSVVLIRSDALSPQSVGRVFVAAIRRAELELKSGAIVSIDAARARVRILPLNEG